MKFQVLFLSALAFAQTGSTTGSTGSGDCNTLFASAISQASSACPGVDVQSPVNNNNACQSGCLFILQGIAGGNLAQVCGSNSVALGAIQRITQQVGNCPFVINTSASVAQTKTNAPGVTTTAGASRTAAATATVSGQAQATTGQSAATTNGPAAQYPTMGSADRASAIAGLLSLVFLL
ncbi:hypothetical protein HDV01_002189 [Terramyces sp. JEL0728]|nr:hypothetical protein HDV01_002189 [Terramyces sp. JEL0728]